MKEALVESNLPIRVDIVDWAHIPAGFQREIERAYAVVQTGNAMGVGSKENGE